jgi:Na+(H+)/acetate symporter ActP
MKLEAIIALSVMAVVALLSAVIGSLGVRVARSTSDFMTASRTVGLMANAGAISGEYLSAASFLGIAGLILRDGVDALWYPVGFAAGYLALLLFVAAPMRRSGAYAVPDFAEARLRSRTLRTICTWLVVLIGCLYLLPQLQGAGLTLSVVTGWPSWVGVLASTVIVVATVALGGMRSITYVQAFQYWFKFAALTIPVIIAVIFFVSDERTFERVAPPQFPDRTVVDVRTDVTLQVQSTIVFTASGNVDGVVYDRGQVRWEPGEHVVGEGARLEFPGGAPVPVVTGAPVNDSDWLSPLSSQHDGGLLGTYSLMIALFLGTIGLPHVLVRFYTNPDGRAARRTAVVVLAMIGLFYMVVTMVGAMSRLYNPQLLVNGDTDATVLLLPVAVLGSSWAGMLLAAVVAAGAWAAFLSTSSGLIVSIAGVLSTDLLGSGKLRDFRLAAILAALPPLGLTFLVTRLSFAEAVALVFAVAASTFCPLLLLGIWWRGLTDRGAIAGVLVGGTASVGAVAVGLTGLLADAPYAVLLHRPAVLTVPAAFLVMVVVSRLTAKRNPPDTDAVLLRMHAPERLGLSRDRTGDRTRL